MWNLTPSERLRFWSDFRQKINHCELESAIKETTHLWSYAPFVKNYLHYDFFDKWPNPWELLYENVYCDLAKVLGIFYTLYLSKHRPLMEIRVYNDLITNEQYNLVWIDKGKYVINYIFDDIVNKKQITKDIKLIKTITIDDLKITKLE